MMERGVKMSGDATLNAERAFIDVFAEVPLSQLIEIHVGLNWAEAKG
jgi:hypothetical protein